MSDKLTVTCVKQIFTKIEVNHPIESFFFSSFIALRPQNASSKNFFLKFAEGKCVDRNIGINTMSKMPMSIAEYLQLESPHLYTSHTFRKTAAKFV